MRNISMLSIPLAVVLVALPLVSAGQSADPAQTPPTALDRAENNPAKAAAQVSEALKQEEARGVQDVSVGTHADSVVVTAEADSDAAAARAKAAAEKAADGARVTTHIEVREAAPTAAQLEIARRVQEVERALRKDGRTAHLPVTVTVDGGQIGLHGLVPTRGDRSAAEQVARRAAGSAPVRNHLQIPGN